MIFLNPGNHGLVHTKILKMVMQGGNSTPNELSKTAMIADSSVVGSEIGVKIAAAATC